MILIATDEAGYGPKLGPLVVAATVWEIDSAIEFDMNQLSQSFELIAGPIRADGRTIRVDDSKSVFKPRSVDGYGMLQRVTEAGCRWCGIGGEQISLISDLAPSDYDAIAKTPWLASLATEKISTDSVDQILQHWQTGPASLMGIQARIVTANQFNQHCSSGLNKSDLLSAVTLGLVKDMLDQHACCKTKEPIGVYCDRHGGRRYYAGPLQSVFDGTLVQVQSESKTASSYEVPFGNSRFEIRFTVKGDSFTPVAFSSMVAKFLREKSMESLNRFFIEHHAVDLPLRPTAGYPVDADRFLSDIQQTLSALEISNDSFVRLR